MEVTGSCEEVGHCAIHPGGIPVVGVNHTDAVAAPAQEAAIFRIAHLALSAF